MDLYVDIFEQFSIEIWFKIILSYLILGLCLCFAFSLYTKRILFTIRIVSLLYIYFLVLSNLLLWSSFTLVFWITFISFSIVYFLHFNFVGSILQGYKKIGAALNFLYLSLLEIIEKNIQKNSSFYLYLLLEISLIISCLNVLGMIPYSFSVTSQILYPFTLSLTFFLYNNLIGIYSYNFKIFNLFMPGGVPLFITPLLLIIEYISYFARIFSLSIRLCANMLSVHVLLKILIGFAVILLYQSLWGQYLLMLLLSIFLLDISTCFLQAYIFIFLSLVYLSNIIFIH